MLAWTFAGTIAVVCQGRAAVFQEERRKVVVVEKGDSLARIARQAYSGVRENPQSGWLDIYRANTGDLSPYTRLGPIAERDGVQYVDIHPGDLLSIPKPTNSPVIVTQTPQSTPLRPTAVFQPGIESGRQPSPMYRFLPAAVVTGLFLLAVCILLLGCILRRLQNLRFESQRLRDESIRNLKARRSVRNLKARKAAEALKLARLQTARSELAREIRQLESEIKELLLQKKQAADAFQLRLQMDARALGDPPRFTQKDRLSGISDQAKRWLQERYGLADGEVDHQVRTALSTNGLAAIVREIFGRHATVCDWFRTQDFYIAFKNVARGMGLHDGFDQPSQILRCRPVTDKRTYELCLSDRGLEYIVRGYFSGDCTNCGEPFVQSSFQTATLNHILAPGFLNWKILREGVWIGNVYALAVQSESQPILVVDAIQIPWSSPSASQPMGGALPAFESYRYPVESLQEAGQIAEGALEALAVYAEHSGFYALWLSHFVSNFYDLKDHFRLRLNGTGADTGAVSAEMIIGWQGQRESLRLPPHAYIESIGKRAWTLWQFASPVAGSCSSWAPNNIIRDNRPLFPIAPVSHHRRGDVL